MKMGLLMDIIVIERSSSRTIGEDSSMYGYFSVIRKNSSFLWTTPPVYDFRTQA
jgi:hypothetical protein